MAGRLLAAFLPFPKAWTRVPNGSDSIVVSLSPRTSALQCAQRAQGSEEFGGNDFLAMQVFVFVLHFGAEHKTCFVAQTSLLPRLGRKANQLGPFSRTKTAIRMILAAGAIHVHCAGFALGRMPR
jgi:hypothetical protein